MQAQENLFKRINESFKRQGLMKTLNAQLKETEPGRVKITCDFQQGLTQQHGFFHGGVISSLADTACGYAALTVIPAGYEVLTVEFKINFLKPAVTPALIIVGSILKYGKTLLVCESCVYDLNEKELIAKMTATIIAKSYKSA